MKKGPVRSLLGKTFSKLRVIEYAGVTPRGVHFWKCVCECGNYYTTTTTSLEHNHAKSCGCLRKQPRIQLGMLSFDGLVRQVYGHYKQGAKRRNLEFNLPLNEFQKLISSPCFYCGKQPSQVYRPTRYRSSLKYNGVDRVDNFTGYTSLNSIPCCKECNRAKSTLSQEQFFSLVRDIYNLHLKTT